MNKVKILYSKECVCECCGKEHHVLTYEEEVPNYPVNPEWTCTVQFDTFRTKQRFCHCCYKNQNFIPEAMKEENEELARHDYLEKVKCEMILQKI